MEDFEELNELIETKQYTRLRQELADMNDADIAAFLEQMDDAVNHQSACLQGHSFGIEG